jgi:hypothetical protein
VKSTSLKVPILAKSRMKVVAYYLISLLNFQAENI